ncbi:hypothetical protein EVAR_40080_1 [Eumeta japonica]|uniref:Uncharacterized protein n=1 Tax=Eumeta variegata TaxID=151549 RepID=A0A4C1X3I3_EUMVA|nr:hypothetical protein EVAR_40080_1 [Eumeta japonica]
MKSAEPYVKDVKGHTHFSPLRGSCTATGLFVLLDNQIPRETSDGAALDFSYANRNPGRVRLAPSIKRRLEYLLGEENERSASRSTSGRIN